MQQLVNLTGKHGLLHKEESYEANWRQLMQRKILELALIRFSRICEEAQLTQVLIQQKKNVTSFLSTSKLYQFALIFFLTSFCFEQLWYMFICWEKKSLGSQSSPSLTTYIHPQCFLMSVSLSSPYCVLFSSPYLFYLLSLILLTSLTISAHLPQFIFPFSHLKFECTLLPSASLHYPLLILS